jgi:VCBS repeat-containing protein
LTNADADVLSVSSGSNSVSGASLSVKLDQLVKASSDFASIDLLSNGNYTLQVETLSGIQLFDATGEEINKVEATIAVVKDAPLDIALGGATVSEDAATDAVIGSLSALSSEGAASNVTYELIDDDSDATNNAFKISNGNLVVDNANILNYEENTSIELKIEASSGDRSGIETFAVSVTDANDAPVAPSDLTFSVGAGAAQDAEVGYNFTATDEDGDTLAYEIQSQKDSQGADVTLFGINSATGILTAASAIANSDAGDYTLVIGFTDNEGGQGTATVTATVVDNIPPVVSNSDDALTATLSEDASVGAAVFSITGTDDDGEDSAITFDISGNDKFEVNETTGAVTLKSSLDYEGLSTETFKIFAIDEEGTSSAAKEVTVTVTDANDAPVITSGATGADLNETALKGAAVYTTVATDQDARRHTHIQFVWYRCGEFCDIISWGCYIKRIIRL